MLLDLHSILLSSSALNSTQQTALFIASHSMIKQSQISSAVQLLWLAGSTAHMTVAVQQQIANLLDEGLLQHLAKTLPAVQHCSQAAYALLQCITKLAEMATQQQLELLLTSKTHQKQFLTAACASTATACAAAKLLLLLASRGLRAAMLLQPLVHANNEPTAAAAAAVLDVRSWIATAMPPLLHQIHQNLATWPQVAAADASAEPRPLLSVPQQQVGLLLCSAVAVKCGAAALGMSPTILHNVFKTPVALSAVQAILLCSSSPGVLGAAIQMVSQLAAMSTHLAGRCFEAVAPIVGQLLSQPVISSSSSSSSSGGGGGSCSDDSFTAQTAADTMWKELLKRVTDKRMLAAAVAGSLPRAAAAVAFMAAGVPSAALGNTSTDAAPAKPMHHYVMGAASFNSNGSSMMPHVSAFMSMAISYSCYDKPLLPDQPQHTVAVLTSYLPSLLQLTAAAPAVLKQAINSQQNTPALGLVDEQQVESVLLLAIWMLHSWVDAIHHSDLSFGKASTGSFSYEWTEAASTAAISAVAALISPEVVDGVSPGSSIRLYMQTAAIQLVRSILAASQCSSVGQASEATWHEMAAALTAFLGSGKQSLSANVAKRQLLCSASHLAEDLAQHKPHLLLLPFAGKTVDSSSSSSSSKDRVARPSHPMPTTVVDGLSTPSTGAAGPCEPASRVAELLQKHLKAVLAELQRRKLERSSSGQELFAAVEDALHVIGQLGVCS